MILSTGHQSQHICVIIQVTLGLGNAFTSVFNNHVPHLPINAFFFLSYSLSKRENRVSL